MIKKNKLYPALFFGCCVLLSACRSLHAVKEMDMKYASGYCYPEINSPTDTSFLPVPPLPAFVLNDSVLTRQFTQYDILLGHAMGVLPTLQALAKQEIVYREQPIRENLLPLLETRQEILQELTLVSVTLSSISAELDCEGERAEQLAAYLTNKEETLNRKLTTASILFGAAAGIATTSLSDRNVYYGVGLGGSIASATLALATLFPNQSILFSHSRNLLTDIWYQPKKSTVYPPFIWYALTEKTFSNSKEHSICHNLRQRWRLFGELEEENSKKQQHKIDLFFGTGGKYTASELHFRANMINHVQSSIRLINQNLESLMRRLSN